MDPHSRIQAIANEDAALSPEQLEVIHDRREMARSGLRTFRPDASEIANRISELGLAAHAFELDSRGYTVIPPEKVASGDFIECLTDTILRVARERTGVTHSLCKSGNPGRYVTQNASGNAYLLWYLLFEDRIFEEWLENSVLGAMVDYMLQGQAHLSSMMAFVRWRNPDIDDRDADEKLGLALHADSPGSPQGVLPSHYHAIKDLVCNAALVLTPYDEKNGALAIVPGSHRLGHTPRPGEAVAEAVPVEAEVGSLIAWRGGTWHGAFKRASPGLRLNLTTFFCHRCMKTQERYQWAVPDEMLARRSARFARFLGADDPMGWDDEGPDYRRVLRYRSRTAEGAGDSAEVFEAD